MILENLVGLFLLSFLCCTYSQIIREYNYISHKQFDNFQSFANEFVNQDTEKLKQNLILGVADDSCFLELQKMAIFRAVEHFAGGNSLQSASIKKSSFPHLGEHPQFSSECLLIMSYKKGDHLRDPRSVTTATDNISFMHWLTDQIRMQVKVFNRFPFPVHIYYHSESAEPIFQSELPSNHSVELGSFLGHVFSVNIPVNSPANVVSLSPSSEINNRFEYKDDGFRHIVDFFVVSEDEYVVSPHSRLETCEIVAQQTLDDLSFTIPLTSSSFEEEICANLLLRFIEFSHKVWYDKRLGSNYLQPKIVRPVTNTGFELRKLPAETYSWLLNWYRSKQLNQEQVETSAGACMNQHVAPSSITHLDPQLKDRLRDELRPILEEWYGGQLFLTSIYGIRKYINGSVLRMHVDTVRTHVVSAIMNIDQEVERDWPLIILDHDDREHSVIMQKGDMLLYESAKLLHGRPEPFIGSHYDNIFIHFRPVNKEEWDYDWF